MFDTSNLQYKLKLQRIRKVLKKDDLKKISSALTNNPQCK